MKSSFIFSFLTICSIAIFTSCNNDGDAARDAAVNRVESQPAVETPAAATTPQTTEPAQNAEGVWHYTCSNGCAGGAGTATACPACGATLVHNQAYHNTSGTPNPGPANPAANSGLTPVPSPTAEPAQNAAGVWHYTCSNGCAGGAGTATACSKCGATLVHNQAYHQ